MKIEIIESKQKTDTYPCLKASYYDKDKNLKIIVYFTKLNTGFCLYDNVNENKANKTGLFFEEGWREDEFIPLSLNEKVVLSND